jgi:hypothetical protein
MENNLHIFFLTIEIEKVLKNKGKKEKEENVLNDDFRYY